MRIHFYILTYNRPKILSLCVNTLFNNTSIRPEAAFFFDDGSEPDIKRGLLEFCIESSAKGVPTNFECHGVNMGVGWNFENLYQKIDQHNPDIAVIVESDYIWRKGWLEDCLAVFEASPYTLMIPGTSHPDFIDRSKTHGSFIDLMKDQFGEDLRSRDYLYKPFTLNTRRGNILVQGGSNSCGCMILHWSRLQSILNENTKFYSKKLYWKWMDRAFHKNGSGDRRYASDAHMSSTLSMFAEMSMIYNGIDTKTNFGCLDICDYSISSHRCFGGINGMVLGLQEGDTFLHSNGWDMKYLKEDPRKI